MIFMVLSVVWGRIQERTQNFEHLVHETWPWTCGRIVFKFYKMQTKSGNHETCRDVMISYVEDVIKIKKVWCTLSRTMLTNQDISTCDHILHIWYHDISTSFMIFGLRLHFIEFKNNSSASSWSCFVNKMFEILGPFLDTASDYTQYHEYHFLNH